MTCAVPPGPLEPLGTVVLPSIIIIILSAELGSFLGQRLTKLPVDRGVNYSVLEVFRPDYEVVHRYLGLVSIPVLHLYEELLGLAQGQVIPVGQPHPVVLIRVPEALPVEPPGLEEVVRRLAEVTPTLQHRPAPAVCFHITVDIDSFAGAGDGVGAGGCVTIGEQV